MKTHTASRRSLARIETLEHRIAPAGVFKWNVDANGNWATAGNWLLISGDLGAGYPNAVDDVALLGDKITADRTITIPNTVTITLGELNIDDNNAYIVTATGSGKLVFDSSDDDVFLTVSNNGGNGAHSISAPFELHDPMLAFINTTVPITMSGVISDGAETFGLVKSGTGQLSFTGANVNTYGGVTEVANGTLLLDRNDGFSPVTGSLLQIGDGTGGAATAKVVLGSNEQIGALSLVQIYSDGQLDLAGHNEKATQIELFGGTSSGGSVATGAGVLTTQYINARLLNGAGIPTITGVLDFSDGQGSIYVEEGDPATGLQIDAAITGSFDIQKIGGGVLELKGSSTYAHTGKLTISDGVLVLNTTTGDAGISDDILINKNGTLRLAGTTEVPDAATVTVAGGKIEMNAGVTEDWTTLNFTDGGDFSIPPTATFRLWNGGSLTVAAGAANGVTIHGGGAFHFTAASQTLNIGDTSAPVDLLVDTPLGQFAAGSGFTKSGLGRMVIGRDASYTGNTTVNVGVLELDSVTLTSKVLLGGGGTLTGDGGVSGIAGTGIGTLDPGYITSNGNFSLNALNDRFVARGTQVEVIGTVNVTGATLDVLFQQPASSATPIVIIDNNGADAVTGTFAGLIQGAKVVAPSGNFIVSYTGGDGNDITLTPEIVAPNILPGNKIATFTDYNGDLVTVTTTKGTFTAANFLLTGAGAGARFTELDLTVGGFDGALIKIGARQQAGQGDKHTDLGRLTANGVDLVGLTVPGDLGQFTVGNTSNHPKLGLGSLVADSLGLNYVPAQPGVSYPSSIDGPLGFMKIKGDVRGYSLTVHPGGEKSGSIFIGGSLTPSSLGGSGILYVNGPLGAFTILGDVAGGAGVGSGVVNIQGNVGIVSIGGSLLGGTGDYSGTLTTFALGSLKIGHDVVGGSGDTTGRIQASSIATGTIGGGVFGDDGRFSGQIGVSGTIGALTIKGDLRSGDGAVSGAVSADTIKSLIIGGSVFGKNGTSISADSIGTIAIKRDFAGIDGERAIISARGFFFPADAKAAVAIASVTIGGKVSNADILAGYSGNLSHPYTPDAVIGTLMVKGNWENSRAITGAVISTDSKIGNAGDLPFDTGGDANIHARIASIVIGGTVTGTFATGDASGFIAQDFGAITINGAKLLLNPARFTDNFTLGLFGDVFVRELPAS